MSRLNELLQQAGNIGRNEDGSITRLGFSEGYFQALELLKARMKEIGMQVKLTRLETFMVFCRAVIRKQKQL